MLLSPMTNCPDEPRHLYTCEVDTRDLGELCSSFRTPGGKGGSASPWGLGCWGEQGPRVKGGSAPPLRKLGFVEGGPEAAKTRPRKSGQPDFF